MNKKKKLLTTSQINNQSPSNEGQDKTDGNQEIHNLTFSSNKNVNENNNNCGQNRAPGSSGSQIHYLAPLSKYNTQRELSRHAVPLYNEKIIKNPAQETAITPDSNVNRVKIRSALILITLFLITLAIISFIGFKAQAKPKLVSPTDIITQENNHQPEKSLSEYITTSQKFLNQARDLANNNPNQTQEQKQAIISQIDKALEIINQGIRAYPNDDRVYSQRASIYQAIIPLIPEATKFAISDLIQATQLNSKNPDYYLRLAHLYSQIGDFENAASHFFNAHHLSPTDNQILYDLALSLEKAGQIDKAIRYYDKLISLLPVNDQNLENLKKQKANLEKLLVNSNLKQLSEPGMEMIPQKPSNPPPIMGTENLPLEQASLASQVIIASPEQKQAPASATSQTQVNAKTGTGVLPANQTEVTIPSKHVTNEKQIIIVPTSETQNKVLYLLAKKAGEWFKVAIDKPINQKIEFNWWIVD